MKRIVSVTASVFYTMSERPQAAIDRTRVDEDGQVFGSSHSGYAWCVFKVGHGVFVSAAFYSLYEREAILIEAFSLKVLVLLLVEPWLQTDVLAAGL